MIAAGKRDRLIVVQRATLATDPGSGAEVPTWGLLAPAWAQRLDQRATEAWKAGGTAATLEAAWIVEWSPALASITTEDRVFEARKVGDDYEPVGPVFEIIGQPTEIGRRRGIQIVGRTSTDTP